MTPLVQPWRAESTQVHSLGFPFNSGVLKARKCVALGFRPHSCTQCEVVGEKQDSYPSVNRPAISRDDSSVSLS